MQCGWLERSSVSKPTEELLGILTATERNILKQALKVPASKHTEEESVLVRQYWRARALRRKEGKADLRQNVRYREWLRKRRYRTTGEHQPKLYEEFRRMCAQSGTCSSVTTPS